MSCNSSMHTSLPKEYCSVLQHVAVCCSVLQNVAECCSVLQCVTGVAVCCSALQCVTMRCSVLQCVAVCCRMLQRIAVWCNALLQVGTSFHKSPSSHHVCATWLIRLTWHIHVWHDSFTCLRVARLAHVWHDTFTCDMIHSRVALHIHASHASFIPSKTKKWHDSSQI